MSAPVDLTNLRSMTDGDVEMEKALFQEFYSSFEERFASLKASTAETNAETWRQEAHALKGMVLNLGANRLGDLCQNAQENHTAPAADKQKMLVQIEGEYRLVEQFLKQLP